MGGTGRAGAQEPQPSVPQSATGAPTAADTAPTPEGGLAEMGGAFVAAADPAPQEDRPPQGPAPAMGGMYYSYFGDGQLRVAGPSNEPNDSNDKSTDPK